VALGVLKATLLPATGVAPDARATALLRVYDDGSLDVAVVAQPAWLASVARVVLRPAAVGPDVATLIGSSTAFDPGTLLAQVQATVSTAVAAALIANPTAYRVSVRGNSNEDLLSGGLGAAGTTTGHVILTGAAVVPQGGDEVRGALTYQILPDGNADVLLGMASPEIASITSLRLHAGPAGVNGAQVASLTPTASGSSDLRGATTPLGLGLVARICQAPAAFYIEARVAAGAVARGQLSDRRPQVWAAPTSDGRLGAKYSAARAGVTLDFVSFVAAEVKLAVAPQLGIENVLGGALREGPGLPTDPLVLDLGPALGSPDLVKDVSSATLPTQRATLTRLLARPASFHASLSVAPAGVGAVPLHGILSTGSLQFHTDLPVAAGAFDLTVDSLQGARYRYVMVQPVRGEVNGGNLYDGDPNAGGTLLVDLYGANEAPLLGTNVIQGPAALPGTIVARMLAAPEVFRIDFRTPATPAPPGRPVVPLGPGIECATGHAPPIEGVWGGGFSDTRSAPTHTFDITSSMNVNLDSPFASHSGVPPVCADFTIGVDVTEVENATGTPRDVAYQAVGRYEGTNVSFTLLQTSPGAAGQLDGQTFAGTIGLPQGGYAIDAMASTGDFAAVLVPNEFRSVYGGIWVAEGDPDHALRFASAEGGGVGYGASADHDLRGVEVVNGAVRRPFEGVSNETTGTLEPVFNFDGQDFPAVTITFEHSNRFVWTPAGGAPTVFVRDGS
jgi:hypothetical protein